MFLIGQVTPATALFKYSKLFYNIIISFCDLISYLKVHCILLRQFEHIEQQISADSLLQYALNIQSNSVSTFKV